MRSHVRRIGTLSGMQLPVDFFGELAADALDLRQILDARAHDSLQSAEAREQLFAAFGADPRDALQRRSRASLGASRPVSGNGEAVRFISGPLAMPTSAMSERPTSASASLAALTCPLPPSMKIRSGATPSPPAILP